MTVNVVTERGARFPVRRLREGDLIEFATTFADTFAKTRKVTFSVLLLEIEGGTEYISSSDSLYSREYDGWSEYRLTLNFALVSGLSNEHEIVECQNVSEVMSVCQLESYFTKKYRFTVNYDHEISISARILRGGVVIHERARVI